MRYKLHVITPVHVGSGVRLGRMDYVKRKDKFLIIDMQKLAALPEIDPEELSDHLYLSEFDMDKFLESMKVDPYRVTKYSVDCRCNPQGDILSYIKDCNGMAYIPGSSIKGALRTAILWNRIKNSPEMMKDARSAVESAIKNSSSKGAKAHAAEKLEKLFLGDDPSHGNMKANYDHLRVLRVSDSDLISTKFLEVFAVELMSLSRDAVEDKIFLRKKRDLFVEALKPGTETFIKIDLDKFLLSDRAVSELRLEVEDLKELEGITRSYYDKYVRSEIEFFSNYFGNDLNEEPLVFYNKILQLPAKKGGMVLRIGWGGGWHSMTVARLFSELLDDLRRTFKLGKHNVPVFPKTRRLAMLEAGPQPMGWVWLRPA